MQIWKPIEDFFEDEIDLLPFADRIDSSDLE